MVPTGTSTSRTFSLHNRASIQESIQESPFFLLHGQDPRLPSALDMEVFELRSEIDLDTYKGELMTGLVEAWKLAKKHVQQAQRAQKKYYDKKTKEPTYREGDRVFVYMPKEKANKAYKFARPFHGPFRVVEVLETGVVVRRVDQPQGETIRVAFNRVWRCPNPIPEDEFWPVKKSRQLKKNSPKLEEAPGRDVQAESDESNTPSVWEGRLHHQG